MKQLEFKAYFFGQTKWITWIGHGNQELPSFYEEKNLTIHFFGMLLLWNCPLAKYHILYLTSDVSLKDGPDDNNRAT